MVYLENPEMPAPQPILGYLMPTLVGQAANCQLMQPEGQLDQTCPQSQMRDRVE